MRIYLVVDNFASSAKKVCKYTKGSEKFSKFWNEQRSSALFTFVVQSHGFSPMIKSHGYHRDPS